MPTARELLEQADALMRRNRAAAAPEPLVSLEPEPLPVPPTQLTPPTQPAHPHPYAPFGPLTPATPAQTPREVAGQVAPEEVSPAPEPATPSQSVPIPLAVATDEPADLPPDDDFPLLTDAVGVFEDVPEQAQVADQVLAGETPTHAGEPSEWLEHPDDSPSIIDEAPDSIAMVPPISLHNDEEKDTAQAAAPADDTATGTAHLVDAMIAAAPSPDPETVAELSPHAAPASLAPQEGASASVHSPFGTGSVAATGLGEVPTHEMSSAAVEARWQAMAEEIRTQVLQRIDLFTDTGLHEQLGQRLQPIVDRAGADLVNAINQHVGEILRSYVAEAIEREIEHWRADR